jgi:hypothetical protein
MHVHMGRFISRTLDDTNGCGRITTVPDRDCSALGIFEFNGIDGSEEKDRDQGSQAGLF